MHKKNNFIDRLANDFVENNLFFLLLINKDISKEGWKMLIVVVPCLILMIAIIIIKAFKYKTDDENIHLASIAMCESDAMISTLVKAGLGYNNIKSINYNRIVDIKDLKMMDICPEKIIKVRNKYKTN